ncbi:hypothetical protein C499_12590 [Halogeometricum borinquense DSM 11551]|uniref:Uncharacterized protein n=1 Tax=Halogeometricum borinquense (strain ATCC 700274 / DSM 11551 / JCM 10706 / KCTC 4070 / PR3) TaxID=469382 RepID=E4NWJ0_HALBP|nr:hypothetical protein Hbor_37040 [Halogeometricum borinquense DSM 11551]ELY25962.1 hypothetical protein C499_12590 [Halogeometricum borinquense DSM 11551]
MEEAAVFDDSTRRRFVAGVVSVRAVGLAGCLGGRPGNETGSSGKMGETGGSETQTATAPTESSPTTVTDTAREHLGNGLVGLVEADSRSAYADSAGVAYDEGHVRIVVELGSEGNLPSSPTVDVKNRHESLVEGRAAVEDLPALAAADEVSYVRSRRQ